MSYIPHFLRPAWFLALIPLLILFVGLVRGHRGMTRWSAVCDPHLLPYLMVKMNQRRSALWWTLLGMLWGLCVLALAGPSWTQKNSHVYQDQHARVILLDLSTAMNSQDLTPNRWLRARYKVRDILNQPGSGVTGLIVYTGEPFVVSPLTQDRKTIGALLADVNPHIIPVEGARLDRALVLAGKLLEQGGANEGDILVMSAGPVSSADIARAGQLNAQGYRVSVLGVGTSTGAPMVQGDGSHTRSAQGDVVMSQLDEHGLKDVARAGGGMYVPFNGNGDDIGQWIAFAGNKSMQQDALLTQWGVAGWEDQGYWIAVGLLPFALLGFWRLRGLGV